MGRFDRHGSAGRAVAGGVVAGILAGLMLNVVMAGLTVSSGGEIWSAFKGAGTPFLGERSQQPGFDPTALAFGFFGHYLVSVAWGVIFGVLAFGLSRGATVLAGIVYGAVVWAGMFWVVLPLVGLGAMTEHGANGVALLTHLAFGFVLGVAFLPFQVPRRSELPPPTIADRNRATVHP